MQPHAEISIGRNHAGPLFNGAMLKWGKPSMATPRLNSHLLNRERHINASAS
jgi:hypothetical protein